LTEYLPVLKPIRVCVFHGNTGRFQDGALSKSFAAPLRAMWCHGVEQLLALWRRAFLRWGVLKAAWWRLNTGVRVQVDRRVRVRADVFKAVQTKLPIRWAAWAPPGRFAPQYVRPPENVFWVDFWSVAKPLLLATCQTSVRGPVAQWYTREWGAELDRRDRVAAQAMADLRTREKAEAEAEAVREAREACARATRITQYADMLRARGVVVYMQQMPFSYQFFRDQMRVIGMRWDPHAKQWCTNDPTKITRCPRSWLEDEEYYGAAQIAVSKPSSHKRRRVEPDTGLQTRILDFMTVHVP
jgi:hypothetical protein